MDLSYKICDQVSGIEDMSIHTPTPERISSCDGTYLKTCADCGTTKTPLWRSGPAGPKTLCNACGIRSRKKRRALMGPKEEKKIKKSSSGIIKKHSSNHQSSDTSTCSSSSGNGGDNSNNNNNMNSATTTESSEKTSFKVKLLGFGCNNITPMQRPRSNMTSQRRRKISEVEQAAFVLMALSCGSVFA